MKKLLLTGFLVVFTIITFTAQEATVKGRIIDANSSEPIPNVQVQILESLFSTETDSKGLFYFKNTDLPQGEQIVQITKPGFLSKKLKIIIQNSNPINIDPILLELDLTALQAQIGIISLNDDELDQDDGTSYNISGLLQASKDAFLNAASYDFSATFFRPRGLDNANGKVLINGLEMNKMYNGRPQWGDWGGLNDMQRNREFSMGLTPNDYAFGDVAGTTNIIMRASQNREGGQISYAASNRSYRGRIMASYNSGVNQNGWAYSVLLARRYGEEGFQEGTLYDANSFFTSVEKKLNNTHSLNFTAFYTPNRRGRSTANTQEVIDLKGIQYNPNWGYQDGEIRNSRIREIEEPIFMLNHFWDLSQKTKLNTNVGYQTGTIKNSRIDNNGTRLIGEGDTQYTAGGASNPLANYYQNLPSYILGNPELYGDNISPIDYQRAYTAQQAFINDGQVDWEEIYNGNLNSDGSPKASTYVLQDDVTEDKLVTANTIISSKITNNITLNGTLSYRNLKSENYAQVKDLLGGTGYLDIDNFAEAASGDASEETDLSALGQSDLNNINRIALEGDRYKYNYIINAEEISGFAQGQFQYHKVDFFVALSGGSTRYQREGLYENSNFPGDKSYGLSEKLSFTNYGIKGGATYKVSGRHLIDINLGLIQKAPSIRNAFSNARVSNATTIGLEAQKINSADVSYILRSPTIKARLTGFYTGFKNGSDIGFYFTENLSSQGKDEDFFLQEIMTNIEQRHLGAELGIEVQVTPTVKLLGAASLGQYTFTNNPNLYVTSDDLDGPVSFGDGTSKLKGYHVAGGPERAAQIGFEYRDPTFWWFGITTNFFSHAYIDVNNLARTSNFSTDYDGQPFGDYDVEIAKDLLAQEQFDSYSLINLKGGKSWRIKGNYVGFFATISNILNTEYKTGGFEQGRKTNYSDLAADASLSNGRIFGPRYFYGYGATYYINAYFRF
ncbi:hypothetical protein SCB49_06687 [unidentified eubacterium SCB49]|nr:hypothetical protein SCB49_06687 [unidentified eubacterium SCB49]